MWHERTFFFPLLFPDGWYQAFKLFFFWLPVISHRHRWHIVQHGSYSSSRKTAQHSLWNKMSLVPGSIQHFNSFQHAVWLIRNYSEMRLESQFFFPPLAFLLVWQEQIGRNNEMTNVRFSFLACVVPLFTAKPNMRACLPNSTRARWKPDRKEIGKAFHMQWSQTSTNIHLKKNKIIQIKRIYKNHWSKKWNINTI